MRYLRLNKPSFINMYWCFMRAYFFIYDRYLIIYTLLTNVVSKILNSKSSIKNIIGIKQSRIIFECNYYDMNYLLPSNYDYIVYKYPALNEITFLNVVDNLDYVANIEKHQPLDIGSTVSFILVKIKILDAVLKEVDTHDITSFLKNQKESYYVNGAELFTKSFMDWVFINYLKISPTFYNIVILDNNINEVFLSNDKYIRLGKTNYEIIANSS